MKKIYLISTILIFIAGCGGGTTTYVDDNTYNQDSSTLQEEKYPSKSESLTIDGSKEQDVKVISEVSDLNLNLHIDGTKDIYIVASSHFDNQNITIDDDINNAYYRLLDENSKDNNKTIVKTPQKVVDFRSGGFRKLLNSSSDKKYNISLQKRVISSVSEGDSENFCVDMDSNYNCTQYVSATAKKVVRDIDTKYGKKSLVIWLEDSSTISQSDIDALADKFLKAGSDNDIYDWDTNIFGQEWGSGAQDINNNFIGESDIIDILVYDMNNRYLAGYFWAKDNYKNESDFGNMHASNEKIMFYINEPMLDEYPSEAYATLAHEFQHMINFYQRSIIKGIDDPTWLSELLSEATEDMLATKIKINGPRNVDYDDGSAGVSGNLGGRYPTFNENNTISLTNWYTDVAHYSAVSSFGTFLTRNYGGAKLLHDILYSNKEAEEAVVDATGEKDFKTLLRKWATAVMLSNIENPQGQPTYNFGDFKETTYGDITYKLGSINFYNYSPQPEFYSQKRLNSNANLYYRVGYNLSGDINIKVKADKGVDVTVIAK